MVIMIFFSKLDRKLVNLAPKTDFSITKSTNILKTSATLSEWEKVNRPNYSNFGTIPNFENKHLQP